MTDLQDKFGAIGQTISDNHAELLTVLENINTALTNAPSTVFDDILTAIGSTNTLLTGISASMDAQAIQLTGIYNLIDTINTNNSLNAQRLLQLILDTSCPCDTTTPLLPLPIDVTPTELTTTAKCQRIQYFVDLFGSWVIDTGQYLDHHGSISSFAIGNLLALKMLNVSITDSPLNNMSSLTRDTLSSLLNSSGAPSAVDGSLFDAINNADLKQAMLEALYVADNATDGKDAVDTAMTASGIAAPNLLSAMFFSSWANIIYSSIPEVDASVYDGSICAGVPEIIECITIDSTMDDVSDSGSFSVSRMAIVWPSPYTASGNQPEGTRYTHSTNVVLTGTLAGYRLRRISGYTPRIVLWAGSDIVGAPTLTAHDSGEYYTLATGITSIMIDGYGDNTTPFTIEFCIPV